ncbi:hypothetical protein RUESEDTHA_03476 [Ruegeria sp. THAF57]|uniref:flagellar basal body-associated FliL family protein n=1 Tax=Ruegeria sp. THAF57 TaxID=2744555 RepID=UPI0015DFA618|nr:flagellar basal body-associated FliL family protein [Ruegeria sp. THAF57]CAD0186567.1 hypothetical protein RUESEDTHA_03476 [Ruegeria sp. THAF57]
MLNKLIPVVFLLAGLGAGVGAAIALAPKADPEEMAPDDKEPASEAKSTLAKSKDAKPQKKTGKKDQPGDLEYLKLSKQFVIPVVDADRIAAMVTMSLSLEATSGQSDGFYAIEPKLRDRFLQVLFDHANTGGFDGNFTRSDNLSVLREALLDAARREMGPDVSDILITSVNRQDT